MCKLTSSLGMDGEGMTVHEKLDYIMGKYISASKVYYLGTGTIFDIKTLCPYVDYTTLRDNNFIVNVKNLEVTGYAKWENVSGSINKSVFVTVKYDNLNGIATITNTSLDVRYDIKNSSGLYCKFKYYCWFIPCCR